MQRIKKVRLDGISQIGVMNNVTRLSSCVKRPMFVVVKLMLKVTDVGLSGDLGLHTRKKIVVFQTLL